jgi:hypothetical protein
MSLGDAFREGRAGDPARVHALVETARRVTSDGDSDLALNLVSAAAFRCFWGDLEHAGQDVLEAADRIGVDSGNPRLLQIQAYAAPIVGGCGRSRALGRKQSACRSARLVPSRNGRVHRRRF